MNTRVYFDTSALLKEFVSEIGSDLIDKTILAATTTHKGRLQIITSRWSLNEAISVINRKSDNKELNKRDRQEIMAAFVQRWQQTHEEADFRVVPVENELVKRSMLWIDDYKIRPADALHLFTAFTVDCSYFLVHDRKFVNRVKPQPPEELQIIDLTNETDRKHLESQLSL